MDIKVVDNLAHHLLIYCPLTPVSGTWGSWNVLALGGFDRRCAHSLIYYLWAWICCLRMQA